MYLTILLVLCVAAGCSTATAEKPPKPVKARAVEKHSTGNGVRYSASIRPNTQVEVAFMVNGYVDSIAQVRDANGQWRHIQSGDLVRKGSVLARVRQSEYAARVNQANSQEGEARSALDTSNNQFAEARSSVETAKAQLADAEAAFDRATRDFERSKNLFNAESITKADHDASKSQFDAAKARVDAAKSQLEGAQARLATAKSQIGAAQARIKSAEAQTVQARIPLADTQLKAPITGVVIERKIETGTFVSTGATGFVLADLSTVKAAFGVPDLALQDMKLGSTLQVASDGVAGSEFTGHISRVSPSADQNSRVFEVEVTIPNPTGVLRPGMIAALTVNETATTQSEMPAVPLTAITRSQDNAYAVFVIEEQAGKQLARLRHITLGEAFGNSIVVTNGIKIGELVITLGATQVADGEVVQVVP
jgi:RND family efflux transporter MFP subunit